MSWRQKKYSAQWHYLRHNIHTTLISFAPELARQVELLCTLRFNELTYVWVVFLVKRKSQKSSLLPSSNFEPDFMKLHRRRCLPLLTFQNTADSTVWKLEEINVGTFGNLYHWTSVCPSSLAKRCPFISNTEARGIACHVETLYCLTVDNGLYSNRMTVTEVMQCFS